MNAVTTSRLAHEAPQLAHRFERRDYASECQLFRGLSKSETSLWSTRRLKDSRSRKNVQCFREIVLWAADGGCYFTDTHQSVALTGGDTKNGLDCLLGGT